VGRGQGATDQQLLVVAEAKAESFVGTKRLEEEAGGAYSWRNVLSGWFRSAARPPPPRVLLFEGARAGIPARIALPCSRRTAIGYTRMRRFLMK
jgi:hypothetical protein